MSFGKFGVTLNKAVGIFCRCGIVSATCRSVVIVFAEFAVFVIVEQIFATQSPYIKQRIGLTPKLENVGVKLVGIFSLRITYKVVNTAVLLSLPSIVIIGIQICYIFLCKCYGFFEVKHSIISTDSASFAHILYHFSGCGFPRYKANFFFL